MNMSKLPIILEQFENSLTQFGAVLAMEKNPIVRDSAIKRFEITLDLSWKAAKAFLKERKGEDCNFPKDCVRKAFQAGLIGYDDEWITLIDLRNNSTHIYNETFADDLFGKLPHAQKLFLELLKNLKTL